MSAFSRQQAAVAGRPLGWLSLLIFAVLISSGCATERRFDSSWLQAGKTSREDVLFRYGEPAQFYQQGQILAYRLNTLEARKGRPQFTRRPLGEVGYNLILVFNADGRFIYQSIVELKE